MVVLTLGMARPVAASRATWWRLRGTIVLVVLINSCFTEVGLSVPTIPFEDCFGHSSASAWIESGLYHDMCCLTDGFGPCFGGRFTKDACCRPERLKEVSLLRRTFINYARVVGVYRIERSTLFPFLLMRLQLVGPWVEVGVQRGVFSAELMNAVHALEAQDVVSKYWLVDSWLEQPSYVEDNANVMNGLQAENMKITIDNLVPYWEKIGILQMASTNAAATFEDESLAFVYIDARHDYCGVCDDLLAYWPKLKKRGVMGGDDYGYSSSWRLCQNGSRIPGGVKRAVQDIMAKLDVELLTYGDQWFVQKPLG